MTFGGACAEDAAEDVGNVTKGAAESTWNTTAPVRNFAGEVPGKLQGAAESAGEFAADRAKDFWKEYHSPIESIYKFAGANWQNYAQGASAGAPGGAVVGLAVGPEGTAPGAAIGGAAGCAGDVVINIFLQE
jgi:hypothetical protein